jgi:hypothetical protein
VSRLVLPLGTYSWSDGRVTVDVTQHELIVTVYDLRGIARQYATRDLSAIFVPSDLDVPLQKPSHKRGAT